MASRVLSVLFLLLLIVQSVSFVAVKAQEDVDSELEVEEVEEMDVAEDAVEDNESSSFYPLFATGLLPEYPDLKVDVGKPVAVLLSLANLGDQTLNVSFIAGHFVHPQDTSFYIQNFTAREFGVAIPPKTHSTFEYYIFPSPSLETLAMMLVADAVYTEEDGSAFQVRLYNATLSLKEKPYQFDAVNIVSWMLSGAVVAFVFYILNSVFVSDSKTKPGSFAKTLSRVTGASKAAAAGPEDLDDYLPEHLKGSLKTNDSKVAAGVGGKKKKN